MTRSSLAVTLAAARARTGTCGPVSSSGMARASADIAASGPAIADLNYLPAHGGARMDSRSVRARSNRAAGAEAAYSPLLGSWVASHLSKEHQR